jgi:ketosteroid isomerase-like protein
MPTPTDDRLARIADRVEIDALRAEFSDAAMLNDYDRLASLFTPDGALRMPDVPAELVGQEQIRVFGRHRPAEFLVQTSHPGSLEVHGDTATGRTLMHELGRGRDGRSGTNFAIYHDHSERTPNGWRFSERVYELLYLDTTPLTGAPASAWRDAQAGASA